MQKMQKNAEKCRKMQKNGKFTRDQNKSNDQMENIS